jgi:tRNA (guanine37-N1)-methyltransferase
VLLSGDHAAIERWRGARRWRATRQKRPDLLAAAGLDAEDRRELAELAVERADGEGRR